MVDSKFVALVKEATPETYPKRWSGNASKIMNITHSRKQEYSASPNHTFSKLYFYDNLRLCGNNRRYNRKGIRHFKT